MKKNLTFKTALGILCGVLLLAGTATMAQAQSSTTFSRPGNSMNYDHDGNSWYLVSYSDYTYNAEGNLLLQVNTTPNANQPFSKTEITYDAQGNERSYLTYLWQNTAWELAGGNKDSLVYDQQNNITLRVNKWLQNGVWAEQKFESTYNADNNKVLEIRSVLTNGNWVPASRTTYTYANGIITDKVVEEHNGQNWQNVQKEVYAFWHVPNQQPASFIMYRFDAAASQWVPLTRHNIGLTTNGGYVNVAERFQHAAWEFYSRFTAYYDFRGSYTGYLNEYFTNGAWVPAAENQFILTYNSIFDLTEKISRWPNVQGGQMTGPVVDQHKVVYSNFQYFTRVMGTSKTPDATLAVNVFPNPTTGNIQVGITGESSKPLTATISDITGKTLLTRTFSNAEARNLNLETLPKGVYLLRLESEHGTAVKRIVKQ